MVRIVVIDTGLDLNNIKFKNVYADGVAFKLCNNVITTSHDFQDEVGHGTAVSNIILDECAEVQIIPVKVIGINYYTEESVIIEALKYIYNNIECDVINMSLGLNVCTCCSELKRVIDALVERGTVIISAFNNDGSMSYPAILKNVIGVDSSNEFETADYYEFVENSELNIRGFGKNQRVLWLSGQYKIVSGSSFAAAHVSAIVAAFMNNGIKSGEVLANLKKKAAKVISAKPSTELKIPFEIKKAIAFPFNKEMHSVVRFDSDLTFELLNVYDIRESGNIGRVITSNSGREYIIQNMFKIDWDSDFDTIIVGHINVLEKMLHIDLRRYLLLKCKLHKKNMYSFDFISQELLSDTVKQHIFFPYINSEMLPQNTFGKLYHIDKPVLGVFGTGSKQGKFTLQMIIKHFLKKDGYTVGHIGTEPSALLFGCQKVYPMGYENSVDVKGFDSISILNKFMFETAENNEIIIVGSQANTVPPLFGNQCYYTTKQIEYLMGTQPDAVVLCFNAHDSEEYISRTIYTLENLVESKVIASVMFPQKLKEGWAGVNGIMENVTEEDKRHYGQFFKDKYGLEMYCLDNEEGLKALYDECINYFSE